MVKKAISNQHCLLPSPPKVSVVLPVHNGARYLEQSMDSVMGQSFADWELIVIDDASSDNTREIVLGYQDSRIHYSLNGSNVMLPRALNRGFSLAAGEYFTWTSDDNWYAPDALERMCGALDSNKSLQMVYTGYELVDSDGKQVGVEPLYPAVWLPHHNCVGACFLYRRGVHKDVGSYNPDALLAEDYEYWLRIHNRFRIGCIKEVLYSYRIHDTSLRGTYGTEHIAKIATELVVGTCSRRRMLDLTFYRKLTGLRHRLSRKGVVDRFPGCARPLDALLACIERYC